MPVRIVTIPSQIVIGIREKGTYRKISEMFIKLFEYAVPKKNIEINGPPMYIRHENTIKEITLADTFSKADIEVCVPIEKYAESEGDFKVYELPGCQMAKITHRGPYGNCGSTYKELFTWIKENDYTICGPVREVYLNGPLEIPKEETLTEIYVPVKNKEV